MLTGPQIDGRLQAVLGCVGQELSPAPCTSCVVAGPPALDNCCDDGQCSGQLTVHAVALVPIDERLRRATPQVTPCRPGPLGLDLRVTVARCHPTLDARGAAPGCVDLSTAAAQVSDDTAAIYRALACCSGESAVTSVDIAAPPQGGCIVVVGSAIVAVDG